MKNLLVLESVVKAKKLGPKLGAQWAVVPTYGHLMDLPEKAEKGDHWGVKVVGNSLQLNWKISPKGRKQIAYMRKTVSNVKNSGGKVYIATDPDREGEAIGAHVMQLLKLPGNTPRVRFQSMDLRAVREALNSPGVLDKDLVAAQEVRRGLDRVIGYGLSNRLRKPIGRVQAPALQACAVQAKARKEFKPSTSWQPGCKVADTFFALPDPAQKTEEEAIKIARSKPANRVVSRSERKRKVPPPPAAATADVLKAFANSANVDETTKAMQNLFTDGLITYPRTDSRALNTDWVQGMRKGMGKYAGKGDPPGGRVLKHAQEAHEAIRPTSIGLKKPDEVKTRSSLEQRIYHHIFMRAARACMAAGEDTVVRLALDNQAVATLRREDFDGWRKYSSERQQAAKEGKSAKFPEPPDPVVWPLRESDPVEATPAAKGIKAKRPAKPTEAWLVDWLEKNGVGRPSTYATCVKKIIDKALVIRTKNDGLEPTKRGLSLIAVLHQEVPSLLEADYTKEMEDKLDEIARRQVPTSEGAKMVEESIKLATGQTAGGTGTGEKVAQAGM